MNPFPSNNHPPPPPLSPPPPTPSQSPPSTTTMMVSDMSLGFVPGTNANFLSPNESQGVSPPQDATIAPWVSAQDDEPVSPHSPSRHPARFTFFLAHPAPENQPAAHTQ